MSIVRVEKRHAYTVIDNFVINDDRLTGSALGLLVYLLSKPLNWEVSIKSISSLKRFGSHEKVCELLKTFRALGYASMCRNSDGSTEWVIYEKPHSENQNEAQKPHSEKPNSENPNSENPNVLLNKEDNKVNKEKQKTERSNNARAKQTTKQLLEDFGIAGQLADDFIVFRQGKKASITRTALDGFAREANKAGINTAEAVRISIESNWQGFKAHWLQNQRQQNANRNKPEKFDAFKATWDSIQAENSSPGGEDFYPNVIDLRSDVGFTF